MLEEQSGGKAPKETCEKGKPVELKKVENTAVRQVFQQNNPPLVDARGDHGLLIARKHMGWTCTGFAGAPREKTRDGRERPGIRGKPVAGSR